ncbi:MAG: OmpA family protein [Zoogloeaceae bacterium]|jgi:OOP family OmpA-OmpF porin|nr:OmpA family protein [Zoogloeaceae bacterium]
MIKKFARNSIAIALLVGIGMTAAMQAQAQERVYVIDQRDVVAVSGTGLCWRTGYWTPAAAANDPAGCQCDRDLLPAEKCAAAPAAVTPTPPGTPPASRPTSGKVTLAADALFDFNKAVLRAEGKAKLDELAARSGEINLEVILATGHTDRIGKDRYNQQLSEKRAAAVKQYLISKGVEANRIYTEGKGETQPVTGDQCNNLGAESGRNKKLVECLQPDRRVDIELIGTTR